MSESLRAAYVRIMGKAWRGYTYKNKPESYAQARQAVKALWKLHFPKRKFPYECIRTSGNRDTWVRGKRCYINPEAPWSEINHDWSHWCAYRAGIRKPHCDRHLEMERLGAEMLKRRFIRS